MAEFYQNYSRGNKYMIESIYLNLFKNQKFQNTKGLKYEDYFSNPKKVFEAKGISNRINNYGFRDKDFDEVCDLLVAGCSQTWGLALPEEYRFSNIIENNIDLTLHNISTPGNSVSSIVRSIFSYIKEFGSPKYIYCMMPPFERFEYVPDLERFNSRDLSDLKYQERELFSPLIVNTYTSIYDKVQRAPFASEGTLNLETIHFIQTQSLLMLEQYCEAAGIKFMWSTWATWSGMPETIIDLKNKGLGYESFLDIPFKRWKYDFEKQIDHVAINEDCHQALKDKDKNTFHCAADANKFTGTNFDQTQVVAHWGSHRNAHIADLVLFEMKNRWGL